MPKVAQKLPSTIGIGLQPGQPSKPRSRYHGAGIPAHRAEISPCYRVCHAGSARLIKPARVQNHARSGLSWFIASAINRAGSPHVIPGLKLSRHTEAGRLTEPVRLV